MPALDGKAPLLGFASACGQMGSLNSLIIPASRRRGAGVPRYRAYFLNDGGHIVHAVELACETDEEAAEAAHVLLDGRPIELWERARLVARFNPTSNPP